ncbi:MAG: hypothetical protein A2138_12710 [Deltaproteobacteria bacterium RBG_16_71_12]|nr:MAG: hypothetical protein A2138_12710 [Deltaproteobacteria bacterium RBG_16_71_12]
MAAATLLDEVLALARAGDVDAAADVLREARKNGPLAEEHLSVFFQLTTKRGPTDEALELCAEALAVASRPLARSNWALRRGLLRLELADRAGALADLQAVLRLSANEGHVEQARAALVRVAALPKG